MTSLKSVKGFSLVELMVVVAIIAIVSLMAIPSYQGFQARARQKESINLLNTYFAAASATRAEFGLFPGNFVQTGFAPVGQLGYRLLVADGTDLGIAVNDNACISTNAACTCAGNCPNFRTWNEAAVGTVGGTVGPFAPGAGACGALGPPAVSDNAFVMVAAGVISTRSARADRVGINQLKQIEICQDGTK